jgi:hypothetical protein
MHHVAKRDKAMQGEHNANTTLWLQCHWSFNKILEEQRLQRANITSTQYLRQTHDKKRACTAEN